MELLEFTHKQVNAALAGMASVREHMLKVQEVPLRGSARPSIQHELLVHGVHPQLGGDRAARIERQTAAVFEAMQRLTVELEVLASVVDDTIGMNGRLV